MMLTGEQGQKEHLPLKEELLRFRLNVLAFECAVLVELPLSESTSPSRSLSFELKPSSWLLLRKKKRAPHYDKSRLERETGCLKEGRGRQIVASLVLLLLLPQLTLDYRVDIQSHNQNLATYASHRVVACWSSCALSYTSEGHFLLCELYQAVSSAVR